MIGIIDALPALPEPEMLIRGVVDDQIHEYPQTAPVRLVEKAAENVKIAEFRVDIHIIGDIIAVIGIRGRENGREPDSVHIETFYIVKLLYNAEEITDTVSVAVAEAARPYLIDGHFLVPIFACHRTIPPLHGMLFREKTIVNCGFHGLL